MGLKLLRIVAFGLLMSKQRHMLRLKEAAVSGHGAIILALSHRPLSQTYLRRYCQQWLEGYPEEISRTRPQNR